MKMRSVRTELSHADGRMEGTADVKRLRTISQTCPKPACKAKIRKINTSSPPNCFISCNF